MINIFDFPGIVNAEGISFASLKRHSQFTKMPDT